jgi:tRNA dimethylallyltransferase
MQIGTAVPNQAELAAAKHYFIHHKSIQDDYNVGAFEKDAIQLLDKLFKEHQVVIMVGGSGLYLDAVVKGLDYFPVIDPAIREKLNKRLEHEGLSSLQNQLKKLDLKAYKLIKIDNPQRVIRALEICIGAEKPYSSFLNKKKPKRNFKVISIGLTADRKVIYDRINKRVDLMMEKGLLEEVKTLLPYKHLNALNTVGYKELFKYLQGDITLDFAISEIKKNSRRFAKRQLTWFRKDANIHWFDYKTDTSTIVKSIQELLAD